MRQKTVARSWMPSPGTMILLLGVAALALYLMTWGRHLWASPVAPAAKPKPDVTGLVPVPLVRKGIAAFSMITRDNFIDPETKESQALYLKPEDVQNGSFVLSVEAAIGRVVSQDIPEGYALQPHQLLPPGTRPGVVAAVPVGMRAVRIDRGLIPGLEELRRGDRFDLVTFSTQPVTPDEARALPVVGLYAEQFKGKGQDLNSKRIQTLVQNGVVIQPIELPPDALKEYIPGEDGEKTVRQKQRAEQKRSVLIATNPDEALFLTQALSSRLSIQCLLRSGRPTDEEDNIQDALKKDESEEPKQPLTLVERLVGGKRQLVPVPMYQPKKIEQ